MNRNYTKLLFAGIAIGATLSATVANASDDRLWREQVPHRVKSPIVLESKAVEPGKKVGNDSLLWREQVNIVSEDRVYLLEPASQGFSQASDTRLWREQVKPYSAAIEQRVASKSEHTAAAPVSE